VSPGTPPGVDPAHVRARVTRRLIPFLFVLYVVAYLDRINVGFAALQMKADLGFGDAVYGLGAGIFFVGYFLFEVPSNLILERVGARTWIARIMISWGVISSATMFVRDPTGFYLLRFGLGVAEAGFFPGMIHYLSWWFPARERARAVALFMTATAMAGVIGGPVSGALLELDGFAGLAGWQWLFLLEGLPAVGLGLVVLRTLTDRPEQARWLAPAEREWLAGQLAAEREAIRRAHRVGTLGALVHGRVWSLSLLYFLLVLGLYGVSLWLPQLVASLGRMSDFAVGALSAVPYLAACAGMVLVGGHSDRSGERRWHLAGPALCGALGLALAAGAEAPAPALAGLSLAALGIWSGLGPFWTLSGAFLTGEAAAGGIALINSVGNLGGFVGPTLLGYLCESTGGFGAGLLALAAALLAAAALALRVTSPLPSASKHQPEGSP
jgi:ACS family tartrate transporter-like MFS transporter